MFTLNLFFKHLFFIYLCVKLSNKPTKKKDVVQFFFVTNMNIKILRCPKSILLKIGNATVTKVMLKTDFE